VPERLLADRNAPQVRQVGVVDRFPEDEAELRVIEQRLADYRREDSKRFERTPSEPLTGAWSQVARRFRSPDEQHCGAARMAARRLLLRNARRTLLATCAHSRLGRRDTDAEAPSRPIVLLEILDWSTLGVAAGWATKGH
jgi:hypothetical protein